MEDGVFLSTDNGASWTEVNKGIQNIPINSFGLAGTDIFAGAYTGRVFRSTNDGTSWTRLNLTFSDKTVHVACFAFLGSYLFAGTRSSMGAGSGVFLSTDRGVSWAAVNSGLADTTVQSLAVSGTNLFAGTRGGVFLSTNQGTSWAAVNTGLTCENVVSLAVFGTYLFAGTYDYGGGAFLSTNSGKSWSNAGLPEDVSVFALATSGENLFAGTQYDGIFRSTNNGASWTPVSNGLPPDNLDSRVPETINCITTAGRNVFAAPDNLGVCRSTNNGSSWRAVNTGLTNTNVRSLAISGTNVFAGAGNGVWRRPLTEMAVTAIDHDDATIPGRFTLEQNYPNPFNPSTTIKYELPKSSLVRLSVYDILGREVSVLVNERKNAGFHEVEFDAAGLSSGVFIYRMQASEFRQSRRLLLLR